MEKLKLRQLIILFSIVVLCSILFGFYLKSVKLTDSFDYKLMSFVQSNNIFTKNTILLNFIKFITSLGNGVGCFILLIPMGIYFYFNDLKKDFIFLVCSLLITYILNELIKHIVLRKRPIEFFIINVTGYSYPSGHSMNISAFYLTFIFLLNRKKKNRYLDIFIYVLIIMIALSRVILGVHWPTDVIVGLTLGYLSYRLSREIYLNFWRD